MLINGRVTKPLKFEDINSLISFEEWIKNNLTLYGEDDRVEKPNMLTFLKYIQGELKNLDSEVTKEWAKKIISLIERLEDE